MYPSTTRAGTPASRSITAIAAAYCWQKPRLFCQEVDQGVAGVAVLGLEAVLEAVAGSVK